LRYAPTSVGQGFSLAFNVFQVFLANLKVCPTILKKIWRVNEMKRLFVIFVCALTIFCFLSTGWSIERVKKPASGNETEKQRDSVRSVSDEEEENMMQEQKETTGVETKGKKEEGRKEAKKKKENLLDKISKKLKDDYDYFLDKNHNGIDDRLEKEIIKKPQIKEEKKEEKAPQETVKLVKPEKPEKESQKKERGERRRK